MSRSRGSPASWWRRTEQESFLTVSHKLPAEEGAELRRLLRHPFAVVEDDRLGEVLPPAVLVVDRPAELGLGLPGRCDAGPVLRRTQDVLGLRERDECEVEAARLAVEAPEVQEAPGRPG